MRVEGVRVRVRMIRAAQPAVDVTISIGKGRMSENSLLSASSPSCRQNSAVLSRTIASEDKTRCCTSLNIITNEILSHIRAA